MDLDFVNEYGGFIDWDDEICLSSEMDLEDDYQ